MHFETQRKIEELLRTTEGGLDKEYETHCSVEGLEGVLHVESVHVHYGSVDTQLIAVREGGSCTMKYIFTVLKVLV